MAPDAMSDTAVAGLRSDGPDGARDAGRCLGL